MAVDQGLDDTDAYEMARAIRSGELSPVEATRDSASPGMVALR